MGPILQRFYVFLTKSGPKNWALPLACPGAGPGRPKWARYFEHIKVQDRNSGHFGGIIIGFGAMATQMVPKLFFGEIDRKSRPRAGPGRPKWARYFENIKVQDRICGHFGGDFIGFGAIWTQLVANLFLGKSAKNIPII